MRTAAVLALALLAVGCGGSGGADAEEVVRAWSAAVNAGDNGAAAALFANGAEVVQGSRTQRLESRQEAQRWNASLPCAGRIVALRTRGPTVRATFVLRDRKRGRCDSPGERATALFRIRDGRIVLWHQLPHEPAGEPPGVV